MTAPATFRVGVHRLDTPCWVVTHALPSGCVYDAHYDTQTEAATSGPAPVCFGDPPPTGTVSVLWQADQPCWTATAVCGYRFDTDADEVESHWDDPEELRLVLAEAGWVSTRGGWLCCPEPGCGPCGRALTGQAVA